MNEPNRTQVPSGDRRLNVLTFNRFQRCFRLEEWAEPNLCMSEGGSKYGSQFGRVLQPLLSVDSTQNQELGSEKPVSYFPKAGAAEVHGFIHIRQDLEDDGQGAGLNSESPSA